MTSPSPEPDLTQLSDLFSLASWSVSSCKPGFGVANLADWADLGTLWQSEGAQPHLINVQFSRRVTVSWLAIYASTALDDSYTPSKISIRTGNSHADLKEVKFVELGTGSGGGGKAEGWQWVSVGSDLEPIRAHLLQIAIISNHMNGKDTHVRGIRIWAPKERAALQGEVQEEELRPWRTVEFKKHETIR